MYFYRSHAGDTGEDGDYYYRGRLILKWVGTTVLLERLG
jgi:hypothetical protein